MSTLTTGLLSVGDIVGWLGIVFQPSGDTEVFKNLYKLFIHHTLPYQCHRCAESGARVLLWWSVSTDVLGRVGTIH